MSTVRRDVEAGGRRRKSRDALTSRPEIERLVGAAGAPASPRELAGEYAAVDAFHRARLVSVASTPRGEHMSPTPARTGYRAALAAAAAVGLTTTGVAFAASGHAPWTKAASGSASTHATDPTHPTHPRHPTQAASPTHPTHPTHTPKSSGASSE